MGRSCTLKVSATGNVAGFSDFLLTAPHRSILLTKLHSIWDGMRRSDLLQGPWVSSSHTLQDLLRFFVSLRRIRSSANMHSYSSNVASWLRAVATGFVQFLANGLDHYTLHEYPKHSRLDKPPPSFRVGSSVRVHPDAIWDMLHNAEASSSSLSQIIKIRLNDEDGGCDRTRSHHWHRLLVAMYHHGTHLVWQHVNHVCLSADSSTHSYEDALLAIAYSWELDQACYPSLQFQVPGKAVLVEEDELMPHVSLLASQNRCERVAC